MTLSGSLCLRRLSLSLPSGARPDSRHGAAFRKLLASQHMTDEENQEYCRRFAAIQKQIVIEITEEEMLDPASLEVKRGTPGFPGTFALDDYGSGYSSEKNLLELSPKYIKIDLSIIRGIDTDPDKQQIVANIVAYAHPRKMLIIAEGTRNAGGNPQGTRARCRSASGLLSRPPGCNPGIGAFRRAGCHLRLLSPAMTVFTASGRSFCQELFFYFFISIYGKTVNPLFL